MAPILSPEPMPCDVMSVLAAEAAEAVDVVADEAPDMLELI